ncbi:octopamine receptor beta-2R-like [Diadema antillarum]|uniref:octopamine receptor beta-2R-like n=1 Tax=Diadema antillarum TaxID=105358 RepID=UPI003A87C635
MTTDSMLNLGTMSTMSLTFDVDTVEDTSSQQMAVENTTMAKLASATMSSSSALQIDHEPTSVVAIVEGVTMSIIFLVALFANLMAMTTILRDKTLRSNPHNLLILNLTIMDLGVTLTSMTFTIWSIYDHGRLLLDNHILCAINGFGAVLFTFGNFTTILAISVDRYLTVVWSTRFPPTKARTIGLLVFCWALPILNVLPPSFEFLSGFKFHPDTHHCSPKWDDCLYFIIWFTFIFGITVPIMMFCYIAVIRTIRRQEMHLKRHGKTNKSALLNRSSSKEGVINVAMDSISRSKGDTSGSESVTKASNGLKEGDLNAWETTEDAELTDDMKKMAGDVFKKGDQKPKKRKGRTKMERLSTDKRVALTGIMLVMTTVVCWAPYFIIHSCFVPINPSHWLGVVSMWLGYANSMLDPLIYSFMNRRVRARYRALFGWRLDRKKCVSLCRCCGGSDTSGLNDLQH